MHNRNIPGEGTDIMDNDVAIELAGELALAWCLRQIEEVAEIPLGDGTDKFRCGFSTACEELKKRIKGTQFNALLDTVKTALEAK